MVLTSQTACNFPIFEEKFLFQELGMENNFLQKEKEFHKLNAELEMKTNELLKEVKSVMVCIFT